MGTTPQPHPFFMPGVKKKENIMGSSRNAKMEFESSQTMVDFVVMTDSGDHQIFTTSNKIWSGESGKEPDIKPNGIVTGYNLLSVHASDDTIAVAGFTANSEGTEHSVSATTATITRPATDVAKVNSITMTDAGAIAVVAGTDGADTTFSETRGAAGGPPEIPDDSVEVGQIRVTTAAAAVITEAEIYQGSASYTERFDVPTWQIPVNGIGLGLKASTAAEKNAHVKFDDALPAIHTSGAHKKVYIKYYIPIFTEIQRAVDFKRVSNSHSVSSTTVYGDKTFGTPSKTIGTGGFKAYTDNNITDAILDREDKVTTIRQYADRNKPAYTLTQGVLGFADSNPVDNQNYVDATITAEVVTARFAA